MHRKRIAHGSDGFVIFHIDRLFAARMALPVVPRSHQGVLKHRELVVVRADFIQEAERESR